MSRLGWRAVFAVLAVSVALAWFDACRALRFAAHATVAGHAGLRLPR